MKTEVDKVSRGYTNNILSHHIEGWTRLSDRIGKDRVSFWDAVHTKNGTTLRAGHDFDKATVRLIEADIAKQVQTILDRR